MKENNNDDLAICQNQVACGESVPGHDYRLLGFVTDSLNPDTVKRLNYKCTRCGLIIRINLSHTTDEIRKAITTLWRLEKNENSKTGG